MGEVQARKLMPIKNIRITKKINSMEEYIYVFMGEGGFIPSGLFKNYEDAIKWISKNKLSGVLNKLPLGVSLYDWAIKEGHFKPNKGYQNDGKFIQRFSSASIEYWHFEFGKISG